MSSLRHHSRTVLASTFILLMLSVTLAGADNPLTTKDEAIAPRRFPTDYAIPRGDGVHFLLFFLGLCRSPTRLSRFHDVLLGPVVSCEQIE